MVDNSNPRFCFAHLCEGNILHCDITNGMKGLHSILTMKFVQDY